ncbi:MAG: ABC transporter permease [Actinomycetota bacterium]
MQQFIAFTIAGVVTGAVYAIAATGLVMTYSTSGIFNIAHGAIGMLMAFTYWELRYHRGWPAPIALIVVLLIIAPLLGAGIEKTLIRRLRGATVAQSLVVTVGLLVLLLGVGETIWSPVTARPVPEFFGLGGVRIAGVLVTWREIISIFGGIAVAAGLWLMLTKTRMGIAMRAVVDDRALVSLNGARPDRVSMLAWAIGASLAALAGILLAPLLQLNHLTLTLLVVNAYVAAMVGRLRSFPLTLLGGLALGLIESYAIGYIHLQGWLLGLRPSIPTLFLFVVLLILPESRLRTARLAGADTPRPPTNGMIVAGTAGLLAAAIVASRMLGTSDLILAGQGLVFALIMLSLVPLTGYGGQVSLCQMTFVGLGAFAMAKLGANGSPMGLIVAAVLAAGVGAIVALPALRLQGLYLALSTLAFAALMDNMFFQDPHVFGNLGSVPVGRLKLLGIHFASERSYLVLLALAFAAMSILVVWMRRTRMGRRLNAMRDSQVACATLGLSVTRTKLTVFVISAAMAGVAGALYGGLLGSAGPTQFKMFQSLPILLLAVIGGITTVSGAFVGGIAFAVLSILSQHFPALSGLQYLLVGGGALIVGFLPNGISMLIADTFRPLLHARKPKPIQEQEEVPAVAAAAR